MIKAGSPYWLYMAEAEGRDDLVSTKTAKLNAIVKEINSYSGNSIDFSVVQRIAARHGIPNLTRSDIAYIQDRI